jgi:hypothetical protein
MSCDNSIYPTAVDQDPCLRRRLEFGDLATAREADLEGHKSLKQGRLGLPAAQFKSKGHRHEVQSRTIPDSTQIEPEYVWGDEGPIND